MSDHEDILAVKLKTSIYFDLWKYTKWNLSWNIKEKNEKPATKSAELSVVKFIDETEIKVICGFCKLNWESTLY